MPARVKGAKGDVMAFSRKFLLDHGVPEDQVDAIMAERNRTLNDYIPKVDLQQQIDAAVQKAREEAPQAVNITESDEYKALAGELAKVKAISSEDFASVKPKFRESVWSMLDHDKPVGEQLAGIKEQYEEYFAAPEEPRNTPQYSRQPGPQKQNPTSAEDELYQKLKDNW